MAYEILPATFEHLPFLRLLYTRWMLEHEPTYPTLDDEEFDNFVGSIARHLNVNPRFACFVCTVGRGRVVGFLAGEITERAIGKPHKVGTAHWLYVVPKHRKKGVTKALIATGLRWLLENGIDTVELGEEYSPELQWTRRGFKPFNVKYYLSLNEIAANLAPVTNEPPAEGST